MAPDLSRTLSHPNPSARRLLWLLPLALGLAECSKDEPPPCTSEDDCEEGQACAPDGRCVTGAECVNDAPCIAQNVRRVCNLTSLTCELRPGFGDECDPGRPCAFGQFCSPMLGRCLDAGSAQDCTRRGQCPGGQTCDTQASKCIPDLGCYGDEFCEEGEICDLSTHACRQIVVECTRCATGDTCAGAGQRCVAERKECVNSGADPTCRPGEFCDLLSRCVQCSNSSQCGDGLFCNVALGRCESNIQCANDPSDCPAGPEITCEVCQAPQICDARTHRCQAPPTPCENDTACTAEQRCDRTQNPPICVQRIPDCLGDLFEPNGIPAIAKPLPTAAGPVFSDLKLCPGDVDWYRLEVTAGTYLVIDARFRQREGDLDLQLFLNDGQTLLAESRSVTDNERVELAVGTDLVLLVRAAFGAPSDDPLPYRLVVSRDPTLVCADDSHEPDDVSTQAAEIRSDEPYEGRVCSGDPDWFVVRAVPAGTQLRAQLSFVRNLGNLGLELVRAGSLTALATASAIDGGSELVYDATFLGDYYLRVRGQAADANGYTLRVNLRDNPGAVCVDDRLEPNAAATEAKRAPEDTTPEALGLSICTADEDWYVADIPSFLGLDAEITFAPGVDLDLDLYGPTGDAPIRLSNGTSPREHIAYRSFSGGKYYLRVHGANASQAGTYDLFVRRLQEFFLCDPDEIDLQSRGNTQADPFDLPMAPFRKSPLTLCDTDQDWVRLTLIAGSTNVIQLHYTRDDATLDLALFDDTGAQLAATTGADTDTKEIQVNVAGVGLATAIAHVVKTGGGDTEYGLSVDLVPSFSCVPDLREPNEGPLQPTVVPSSTVTPILLGGLTLCASTPDPQTSQGDEDWFRIQPPAPGAQIHATIRFERGDLFLELLSPGGTHRSCANDGVSRCYSDGFDLMERITFTATTTDPYYLRVGSIYGSPSVQVRPIGIDTPYTLELELREP